MVPGSVEEPRTGKGESVRQSPLVGNTVRAGKIPCQKQNTVWVIFYKSGRAFMQLM